MNDIPLPNDIPVKGDLIRQRRDARGWTQQTLGDKSGVGRRTIQRMETEPDSQFQKDNVCRVADTLDYRPHEIINWEKVSCPIFLSPLIEPLVSLPGRHDDMPQELKNVLHSKELSEALLRGEAPSFAQCVKNSYTFLTFDESQKDAAYVAEVGYNHFLCPSGVFEITWPGCPTPRMIAYHRLPPANVPEYRFTQGLSILLAASFYYNVQGRAGDWMDHWMRLVDNHPASTQVRFDDIFLRLLAASKVDFGLLKDKRWPCVGRPLGVVTNDLRALKNRVYTQYVFRMTITVGNCEDAAKLCSFVPSQTQRLILLDKDLDDHEKAFTSPSGRKNAMDILAWNAMRGMNQNGEYETARLVSGFQIL